MTHVVERDVFLVLRDVAENADVDLRPDYSGRAMYGDTCLAIVTDDMQGLVKFVIGLVSAVNVGDPDVAERVSALVDELEAGGLRQDNMGRGFVLYWPKVTVTS